jgi:hypothetical protein
VERARKQFPSSKTENKKTNEYKTNKPIHNATFSQGPPQDGDPGRDGAFEAGEGYTGGPIGGPTTFLNQLVPQNGWSAHFGNPNFDVFTYAGNQVQYIPNGAVPVIGGIPQLVTIPQNPTGGSQFVAAGNANGRDIHLADFTPDAFGLVEISVDYHPGDWFDNNGGNYNGAFHMRNAGGTLIGGLQMGRGSSQPSGDVNGNGLWAPVWEVRNAANVELSTPGGFQGLRMDGATGFDNLVRQWTRVGVVYDSVTGQITQFKTQELIPGGNIWTMDNPVGPLAQPLYIAGGAGTPTAATNVGIYNVGNGTLSAYDNVYVGAPYTWAPVVPEPSTVGLLLAGLSALGLVRRRK